MASIVLDLQSEALSKQVPITDLLRKALLVATKLKVTDFESWIQKELDGYGKASIDQIPSYRRVCGTPMVWNPYHGWQPIMFESQEEAERLSTTASSQAIAEVEHLVANHRPNGYFEMQYPGEVAKSLMDAIGLDLRPSLHIPPAAMNRILDSVRNTVLKWALRLEEDGILGTGISFTADEVKSAERAHYTTNNFHGDVVNSQVQQGTTKSFQKR